MIAVGIPTFQQLGNPKQPQGILARLFPPHRHQSLLCWDNRWAQACTEWVLSDQEQLWPFPLGLIQLLFPSLPPWGRQESPFPCLSGDLNGVPKAIPAMIIPHLPMVGMCTRWMWAIPSSHSQGQGSWITSDPLHIPKSLSFSSRAWEIMDNP